MYFVDQIYVLIKGHEIIINGNGDAVSVSKRSHKDGI